AGECYRLAMKRPLGRAPLLAVGLSAAGGAFAWTSCGGTTGRDNLAPLRRIESPSSDPVDAAAPETDGVLVASGGDAGAADPPLPDVDEGLFDVIISYADRPLPEVHAPVDSGGAVGIRWPRCPRDFGIDSNGNPTTDYSVSAGIVPAEYDDAG